MSTEESIHRWLSGGDDKGYGRLPKATSDLVGKTVDLDVLHPHYGPLKITWLCWSYRYRRSTLCTWQVQSAIQLDPDAPRPRQVQGFQDDRLGIGARERNPSGSE